jgi:hypothetical protein
MQKILPGDIFLIFGGLVLGLGLAHTYFYSTAVRAYPSLSLMKQLRCTPSCMIAYDHIGNSVL